MTANHVIKVVTTPALVFILISAAFAGGWAIVSVDDFPEYAVAGKPVNLTFAVRQHGVTLLPGLRPTIRATTATGLTSKADVMPAAGRGEYAAALTLPQQGEWTITIANGFNDSNVTLPALKVIAPGAPAPAPFSPPTRGLRLFTSKGCIGCHRHIEVNPERVTEVKFDLTGKRFPQDYLKRFLADPSIKSAEMPNFKLKSGEIEALAAFINKLASKTREEVQR
jgi:mono/diheme cytochrome c family protein